VAFLFIIDDGFYWYIEGEESTISILSICTVHMLKGHECGNGLEMNQEISRLNPSAQVKF
jgi:hypothetical protein